MTTRSRPATYRTTGGQVRRMPRAFTPWPTVLDRARVLVAAYSITPTLRQLFYRLVSEQLIPNDRSAYQGLAKRTAIGRDDGTFPDLDDRTRSIGGGGPDTTDPRDYAEAMLRGLAAYGARHNRTDGQPEQVILGVEKDGMVAQLEDAFTDYDLTVVALRGYGSQPYRQRVRRLVEHDPRPAVLLYAGDYDPSGEDILRDFLVKSGGPDLWSAVERVALTEEQVAEWDLPVNAGKDTDPRAARFTDAHGGLWQVEVDALGPDRLVDLFRDAHARHHDPDAYADVLDAEQDDAATLGRWSAALLDRLAELPDDPTST